MACQLTISPEQVHSLCFRWQVRELALFGSVLREDFSDSSDIDVLVSFKPETRWSAWDLMRMKEELENLFGRPVDLIEKEALRNPWRKQEILRTHEVIYAAR